ncbi:unnamed protein product [Closterium sp. NIES-54]
MDVAHTSMIHAAAPHFLWPFAVQYAAHQIILQPHVSLPETIPTLRWTGKVGDASAFRDVTFDESVSYYHLFPYRTASLPPPPLFLAPGTPPVDPLPPQGPAPSGVSHVDPAESVEVAVDSGAEPRGAEPEHVEPGGADSGGGEPARAESGGSPGVPLRGEPLSPQRLREWYARRCCRAPGAAGAGATGGAAGARAAGGAAGARAARGAVGAGAAAGATAAGAAGGAAGAGAAGGAAGAGAARGTAGAGAAGGTAGARAAGGAASAGATEAASPGGARTGGIGGAGVGGTARVGAAGIAAGGAAGVVTGDPGAASTGAVSAVEDRHEEFECFTAAVPHPVSMLLAPEGDPDAPNIPTPRTYAEAIKGTSVDEVPPPGANIVCGMWIFRVKRSPGSPPVFKVRYVVCGFSQRQGVDFFQTFSPTPKMTTLRVLLHVAAQRDYELHSLDFSTAFLQGSLHKEIWLRSPPSFTGSFPAGTQWSLRRPVYGLRQAPREWHDTFRTTLATLGFDPSTADPSLFLCTDTTLTPFFILVYIDDLVFATADTKALAFVKAQCTITLTQSHMVQQVLQHFGFTYSSPQSTPLPAGHSLSAPPSDESVEPSGPYPELVGCLMYLMTCTRPDLAYPLSLLARYVAPGRHRKVDWDAAKRVLRYLCSTSGMGLVLGGRARVVLTGHADASWVDDLATQRSS